MDIVIRISNVNNTYNEIMTVINELDSIDNIICTGCGIANEYIEKNFCEKKE